MFDMFGGGWGLGRELMTLVWMCFEDDVKARDWISEGLLPGLFHQAWLVAWRKNKKNSCCNVRH